MLEWTKGLHTEEDLWQLWLNSPSVKSFETGQISPHTFAQEFIKEFSLPVSTDTFIQTFVTWTTLPYTGGRKLMERLNGHFTTASLSNTNILHWTNLCKTQDIESLFHHNFPSHRMRIMKPDPTIFEVVLDRLETTPEETLFFDDTQANIDAALSLGIGAHQVCGVSELQEKLMELYIL